MLGSILREHYGFAGSLEALGSKWIQMKLNLEVQDVSNSKSLGSEQSVLPTERQNVVGHMNLQEDLAGAVGMSWRKDENFCWRPLNCVLANVMQ